jgi:HIP---CoA ligase
LLVRGPNVMLGYLDDPEATAAAIDFDGWLHTGDVGEIGDDGHLRITDRLKDMYISGGFNVYPAEVEQTLARLDGLADAAVIGVPDTRLGEVGLALVVRRDDALDEAAVLAFCRERLANYKVPRQVRFVDTLPRNLAGKLLKTDLRKAYA